MMRGIDGDAIHSVKLVSSKIRGVQERLSIGRYLGEPGVCVTGETGLKRMSCRKIPGRGLSRDIDRARIIDCQGCSRVIGTATKISGIQEFRTSRIEFGNESI